MKKFKTNFLLLFLSLPLCLSAQSKYQQAIKKSKFLINAHRSATQVPGVQVAVWVDGDWIWRENFGFEDIEKQKPVSDSTVFRIASVSKSFTSLVFGKLMEEGVLTIDSDIREYLPDFPEKNYSIKVWQLPSSTSGIRHYTSSDPRINQLNYASIEASLDRFKEDPLIFEPGTDFHYSSYGWVLLSVLMEKASGLSFFELMERVWFHLGMNNSSFDLPNNTNPNLAKSYVMGKNQKRIPAPLENRSFMYAGGGMISNVTDMVKVGMEILNPDYLESETIDFLTRPVILENGENTYYGMGWEVGVNRWGDEVIFHSGSMPGARSHLVIFPKERLVFAYLANTGDQFFFNDREAHNIAELFLLTKQGKLEDKPLEGYWELSSESLRDRKFKGTLELNSSGDFKGLGSLYFRRSRRFESFPAIHLGRINGKDWICAVSPMFLDIYLNECDEGFSGEWLHNFRIKGSPNEVEPYWRSRPIQLRTIR
jgi:CubicO group peptidase (beta-lactamase class C family)